MKPILGLALTILLTIKTPLANGGQTATSQGAGHAINADNGATVLIDNSKRIINTINKESERRIVELEIERKQILLEISRLSIDEEGMIISRSRKELLASLPPELQSAYEARNWDPILKYLELAKNRLQSKKEKLGKALSKSEFELALIAFEFDHAKALEYTYSALSNNPDNLQAIALQVQLLSLTGRFKAASLQIENLRRKNKLRIFDEIDSEDANQIAIEFYLYSLMALVSEGQISNAIEIAQIGLDFSKTSKTIDKQKFADVERIFQLILNVLEQIENSKKSISEYEILKSIVSNVDYSFSNCENCFGYMTTIAGYNLAVANFAYLRGDFNTTKENQERVVKIITMKSFPSSAWESLQFQLLKSIARGAKLSENSELYIEYLKKAQNHLKRGLQSRTISYQLALDLIALELEEVNEETLTNKNSANYEKLGRIESKLKNLVKSTRGYEIEHFNLHLNLADNYSLSGFTIKAESAYLDVESILNGLTSEIETQEHLQLKNKLLLSKGYHQLRNKLLSELNATIDQIIENQKKLGIK